MENKELTPEAKRVLKIVELWPLTVEDVEIYAQFSEYTGLHGSSLKSFLWEALRARQDTAREARKGGERNGYKHKQ